MITMNCSGIPCWRLVEKPDPSTAALGGKEYSEPTRTDPGYGQAKERHKKIVLDRGAVDRLLVDVFLQTHREAPKEII